MNAPTILKFSHSTPTCLWRCNRQSVPKRRHIKFRRWGITQEKTYNSKFLHEFSRSTFKWNPCTSSGTCSMRITVLVHSKKGYNTVSCRIQSALIDVSVSLCLYGIITLITLFTTTTTGRNPEQDKSGYNFYTAPLSIDYLKMFIQCGLPVHYQYPIQIFLALEKIFPSDICALLEYYAA
jgi:hypothetical protein